jgi:site-specific DNA-methyltransferase (adenine-specific)
LIGSFSLPGELVLDPFAGSGSSCAAALLTGRRYIGIEMDDAYFQQAHVRMERVKVRIAAKRLSPSSFPRSIHDTCVPSRIKANDCSVM